MPPSTDRINGKWQPIVCCLIVFAIQSNRAVADSAPPPARENRDSQQSARDTNTLKIAIYLAILVTVAVASGFLLMMLWGARVRRQARKPLPGTAPNDPLWYLKKSSNPPPGEPDDPTRASDEDSETDRPEDSSSSP